MFQNPLADRLTAFVRGIGIEAVAASLPEPTFLPGLDIRYGVLLIDDARLTYPGDMLRVCRAESSPPRLASERQRR